uniref:Gfo/Idh/MocA family oxidoreductase n=1 Tax=Paenibacillus sp. O199 TaxID=1643925 RepID=UPI000A75863D
MGKDKVRIGIIGAGRIGKIHADNLMRNPHAEIVGISDLFAGPELEEWASSRGIPVVTTDSSQLIAMPNVDAVLICSSTDTHVPLIEQAAQAGKHIFCEKPVSMDLHQTQAAVAAVQKAGVKL